MSLPTREKICQTLRPLLLLENGAAFAVTIHWVGKWRSLELINAPITKNEMMLSAGLNLTASYLMNLFVETDSSVYRIGVTIVGLAIGALAAPYVASKVFQNQAVLLTHEIAFRIAAFNLATKAAIFVAFKMTETLYNMLTFPGLEHFEEMTPTQLGRVAAYYLGTKEAWEKRSFGQQIHLNGILNEHGIDLIPLTTVDTKGHRLTSKEAQAFDKLYGGGPLKTEQAEVLYAHDVPPQSRSYRADEMPAIDPKTIKVEDLSSAQLRWHYEWIKTHPKTELPDGQIQAFAEQFHALNLEHLGETFLVELPPPKKSEGVTTRQITYFYTFYTKFLDRWAVLHPTHQCLLNALFVQEGLDVLTLRDPTVEEIQTLSPEALKQLRHRYQSNPVIHWELATERFQKAFNRALSNHELEMIPPTKDWKATATKAAAVVVCLLAVVGLGGLAYLSLSGESSPKPMQPGELKEDAQDLTDQPLEGNQQLSDVPHEAPVMNQTSSTAFELPSDGEENVKALTSWKFYPTSSLEDKKLHETICLAEDFFLKEVKMAEEERTPPLLVDQQEVFPEVESRSDLVAVDLWKNSRFYDARHLKALEDREVMPFAEPEKAEEKGKQTGAHLTSVNSWKNSRFYDARHLKALGDREVMPFAEPEGVEEGIQDLTGQPSEENLQLSDVPHEAPVMNQTSLTSFELPSDGEESVNALTPWEFYPTSSLEDKKLHEIACLAGDFFLKDVKMPEEESTGDQQEVFLEVESRSDLVAVDSSKNSRFYDARHLKALGDREVMPFVEVIESEQEEKIEEQPLAPQPSWKETLFSVNAMATGAIFLTVVLFLKKCFFSQRKLVNRPKQSGSVVTAGGSPAVASPKKKNKGVKSRRPTSRSAPLARELFPSSSSRGETHASSSSACRDITDTVPVTFSTPGQKSLDVEQALEGFNFDNPSTLSPELAPYVEFLSGMEPELLGGAGVGWSPDTPDPQIGSLQNGAKFILTNLRGVRIDRKDLDERSFLKLVQHLSLPEHKMGALIIDGNRTEDTSKAFVQVLSTGRLNTHLQTLGLHNVGKVLQEDLIAMKEKFPRVGAFDLRTSEVEGSLEAIKKSHMVLDDDGGNVQACLSHMNRYLGELVASFKTHREESIFLDVIRGFADEASNPLGPARLYVENVSFFRGLEISDRLVDEIQIHIKRNFPALRLLDLSECPELTVASLDHLGTLHLEALVMKDCAHLSERFSQTARKRVFDANAQNAMIAALQKLAKCLSFLDLRGSLNLDLEEREYLNDEATRKRKNGEIGSLLHNIIHGQPRTNSARQVMRDGAGRVLRDPPNRRLAWVQFTVRGEDKSFKRDSDGPAASSSAHS